MFIGQVTEVGSLDELKLIGCSIIFGIDSWQMSFGYEKELIQLRAAYDQLLGMVEAERVYDAGFCRSLGHRLRN